MRRFVGQLLALCMVLLLSSCGGGGDSSVSTVICKSANCNLLSPAVGSFVQGAHNLQVTVEDGPRSFSLVPNANILYATVKVCKPNANPSSTSDCQTIDKVLVDTGSVGLRLLSSQVSKLALEPLQIAVTTNSTTTTQGAWECFQFVVGGLWGKTAAVDVYLGSMQTQGPVAVQLIEDKPDTDPSKVKAPANCQLWADNALYETATGLGANGILGIGSTNLDCGSTCLSVATGIDAQYYGCPLGQPQAGGCTAARVDLNQQVSNPVSALPAPYNDGVVIAMPAVNDPGASTATGELVFGVGTLPAGTTRVQLGVDYQNKPASYLNITTQFNGHTFVDSYLDTGTNFLRFSDSSIPLCVSDAISYCRTALGDLSALLSDGDNPLQNPVTVPFRVGNSDALLQTSNTAFGSLAAAISAGDPTNPSAKNTSTFAWGLPFFYGKRVYQSIWDITSNSSPAPWYAWTAL